MGSAPMIVIGERLKAPAQTIFVERDDVIETLTVYRSNPSFHVGALPGRPRSRQHFLGSHRLNLLDELMPEYAIAIAQEKARTEVDEFVSESVSQLRYLEAVLIEFLRVYPAEDLLPAAAHAY
jgi:GAF domain-containing protein